MKQPIATSKAFKIVIFVLLLSTILSTFFLVDIIRKISELHSINLQYVSTAIPLVPTDEKVSKQTLEILIMELPLLLKKSIIACIFLGLQLGASITTLVGVLFFYYTDKRPASRINKTNPSLNN